MQNTRFIWGVLALGAVCTAQAQQGFKQESVSIFKNASAFHIKTGSVPANDRHWQWQSDSLPAPLEGTFWVATPDNEIVSLKSSRTEKTEMDFARSYADMLQANEGKRLRIYFQGDTAKIEGKVQVLHKAKDPYSYMYAVVNGNKTMVFSQERLPQIQRLDFLEPANFQKEYKTLVPTIRFEFKEAKSKQPLALMYLQKGLTWNPEYKLELLEETKALLTLQAAVVNESEDVNADALNLVAGVPNFKYATDVHRFLRFMIPQIQSLYNYDLDNMTQMQGASISNSFQMYNDRTFTTDIGTTTNTPDAAPEADGNAVEDLYFYTLRNVQLLRGERALYHIFTAEVPVEHIYETHIPDNAVTYTTIYDPEKITNKVAHNIKLKNTTPHTWTSGSIMVLLNNKGKLSPVSQDALKYTSMQEDRLVYLTEAPDVSVKSSEKEAARKVDDKKILLNQYNYLYDLVTVNAEIDIQNYKDKPVRLDVKRLVHGELLETSSEWKTVRRPVSQNAVHPSTQVCWELKLAAKEKKTIQYSYKMYVLRHSYYNN